MEPIRIIADTLRTINIPTPVITQHDNKREIVVTIRQDGMDLPLSDDITYTITSRREDGETFYSTPGVKVEDNVISFKLGSSEVEITGSVEASIQMFIEGVRVSSLKFGYRVVEDLSSNYIPSEDERTLIEIVLYEGPGIIKDAKDAAQEARDAAEVALKAKGPKGDKGDRGVTGPQGIQGPKGPKGDTGPQGPKGVQGDKGDKGDTGPQGPQGVPGPKGDRGDTGPQGLKGDKGDKGDPGPEGPKGEQGEKGEQGTGLNILGSLTDENELPSSGESGDAYLINGDLYVWTGNDWENVGNIKGPKGDRGEDGVKGDQGEPGPQGEQGMPGEPGPKGEQGETGPKGDRGEQGEPGPQGEPGKDGEQGETGPPGSDATVVLNNTVTSTSTTEAATANAVKQAYDRAEEAFTQANDIKGKWASVVGSPLSASDTQAQLQSKTQTIKNTLATNLTSKGQSSSGTLSLQTLASRVANISTGKKWASGTFTQLTNGEYSFNINFNASVIVLEALEMRYNSPAKRGVIIIFSNAQGSVIKYSRDFVYMGVQETLTYDNRTIRLNTPSVYGLNHGEWTVYE